MNRKRLIILGAMTLFLATFWGTLRKLTTVLPDSAVVDQAEKPEPPPASSVEDSTQAATTLSSKKPDRPAVPLVDPGLLDPPMIAVSGTTPRDTGPFLDADLPPAAEPSSSVPPRDTGLFIDADDPEMSGHPAPARTSTLDTRPLLDADDETSAQPSEGRVPKDTGAFVDAAH